MIAESSPAPATAEAMHPVVAHALEFTATHRQYAGAHKAIREAMCLRVQFPAILGTIRPGDLYAGRKADTPNIVFTGTMRWTHVPQSASGEWFESKQGGYAFDFRSPEKYGTTPEARRLLDDMAAYWAERSVRERVRRQWDPELKAHLDAWGQVDGGATGFCAAMDLGRLARRGIPGLLADVAACRARAEADGQETAFYDGLRIALEVLADVCRHYERQAAVLSETAPDPAERTRMEAMAQTLGAIATRAPQTLREALQLVWLYLLLSSWEHPESARLDCALGDFYARDIDSGRATEEEAIEQLVGFWDIMHHTGAAALCRIVIGGQGRPNEAVADRFALAAMEATRRHRQVTPQLTLRLYQGQNPALLDKALDTIAATGVYPMLYNDDVIVPAVAQSLRVPLADAVDYYPLGCGEYMIAKASPSLLMCGWNVGHTVDAALRNGRNSRGERIGPETGEAESFDTFEKLYAAVQTQIRFAAGVAARTYRSVCGELPQHAAFLYVSLLTEDCLERGLPLLDGGARYNGCCIMGHGFSNAADSLTAIRELVYRRKRYTLREVVAALDANFAGHEPLRRELRAAPKFGNDNDAADNMLVELWRSMNRATAQAGEAAGLDFLTLSSVNPGGYYMGERCGATADGRGAGQPFAIGHAPTAGNDTSGITALCRSVAKADPVNGGATTSMKLSPALFAGSRENLQALLAAYFALGGQQASLTVTSRADLEAAIREPEKHGNLMVRIGGWCAKFVTLDATTQQEIIRRTQY